MHHSELWQSTLSDEQEAPCEHDTLCGWDQFRPRRRRPTRRFWWDKLDHTNAIRIKHYNPVVGGLARGVEDDELDILGIRAGYARRHVG